jgi:hypothetical protein
MFGLFSPTTTSVMISREKLKEFADEIRKVISMMNDEQVVDLWTVQHPIHLRVQDDSNKKGD